MDFPLAGGVVTYWHFYLGGARGNPWEKEVKGEKTRRRHAG
jgi:hypothetical protein